jgi:hypothetical protein
LLIGPERVAAGLAHVRTKAQSLVDLAVDNPTALRRQLQDLSEKYPERIATVRGELAEVDHQLGQFEHDAEVSARVVALANDDLGEMKTLITRAEQVHGRPVFVRFEGVRFDLDEAYGEAHRINNVRINYEDRQITNEQQIRVLGQQKTRLVEILVKLEDEQATFETQMWQLDRQIDSIERNQRLIEMTEDLQATLKGYDKWGDLGSLKQLEGKLAELQAIQTAQFDTLAKQGIRQDYEKRARYEMQGGSAHDLDDPFADVEETDSDVEVKTSPDSVVWLGPVIIE